MRKTIVKVLILTAICILSFAGCDSQKGVADNSASVNPTTGATSTAENDSTAKPTETKKEPTKAPSTTLAPTVSSTVEPTKTPTKEPTQVPTQEPTKVPTKEPTVEPTTAPTATSTAVVKPTANPEQYPDDYGFDLGPIRSDGDIFFWKDSRVIYKIPNGAPDATEWSIKLFDSEKDQMIFTTGLSYEELEIYSIVEGDFYKLSEGEVVSMAQQTDIKVFYWVETNGTAKSVGVRSKNFGEVFLEGENIKWIIEIMPTKFRTFEEKKVSPISEDVLLKIKKF